MVYMHIKTGELFHMSGFSMGDYIFCRQEDVIFLGRHYVYENFIWLGKL